MDHQGSDFFIQSVDRVSGIHRTLRQSLSRLIPLFGILFFLGAGFAAGPLEPGRYSSRLGKAELIRQGNMFQLNIQTAEGFYRVVGKEQNGGIQCMVVTPAGEKLSCAATAGDGGRRPVGHSRAGTDLPLHESDPAIGGLRRFRVPGDRDRRATCTKRVRRPLVGLPVYSAQGVECAEDPGRVPAWA